MVLVLITAALSTALRHNHWLGDHIIVLGALACVSMFCWFFLLVAGPVLLWFVCLPLASLRLAGGKAVPQRRILQLVAHTPFPARESPCPIHARTELPVLQAF